MSSSLFSFFQENTKCESSFFAEHVRVAYLFFVCYVTFVRYVTCAQTFPPDYFPLGYIELF